MGREIEIKLFAEGATYEDAAALVRMVTISSLTKYHSSGMVDNYWRPAAHGKGEALRLRASDDIELTAKVNDKGTISDREEHSARINPNDFDGAYAALKAVLGDPVTIIYQFADFEVDRNTTISVIQNLDAKQWTFIEIEAQSHADVAFWKKKLEDAAIAEGLAIQLKTVKNSFFDIFVERQGIRL